MKNKELILRILTLIGLLASFLLYIPQIRNLIIDFGGVCLQKQLNYEFWNEKIIVFAIILSISCLIILIISKYQKSPKNLLLIVSCIAGILVSLTVSSIVFVNPRSLWLDEAYLAASVVHRNWSELLASPLIYGQSAPVLYLCAVKLIASIFNYSECGLRLFSFLSFLGTLSLLTLLLKSMNFSKLKILFIVCITSLTPAYIFYSNELKPYMSDTLFCILIFLIYWFYLQKRLNLWILSFFYCVILLFCSPAFFFVGGIFLIEFISSIRKKDKKVIFTVIITGFCILSIFVAHYILWLSGPSEFMEKYWKEWSENSNFIFKITNLFIPLWENTNSNYLWFFVPVALLGTFSAFIQKDNFYNAMTSSILLVIIASTLGKWPLIGRLWLFLPVLILLLSLYGYEFLKEKIKINNRLIIYSFCILSIFVLSANLLIKDFKMLPTQEANSLISYVQENIKEDEMLYVYYFSTPVLRYKNGYDTDKIGNVNHDNIIWGNESNMNQWLGEKINDTDMSELERVLKYKKVYLLFTHYDFSVGMDFGINYLKQYGSVTKVLDVNNTWLYYFVCF